MQETQANAPPIAWTSRWYTWSSRSTYVCSTWLFLRLLGVVYLIAFVSLGVQIEGLVGERGILPAQGLLDAVRTHFDGRAEIYWQFPTLCWFSAGDAFLKGLCITGAVLALMLIVGIVPLPTLAGLWICYLSLTVVGQAFLGFQWDALLLEAGLLAMLIAPLRVIPGACGVPGVPGTCGLKSARRGFAPQPSPVARWLLWFLLFKLMFLSGVTKLVSGDPTWAFSSMTALEYHYWTQPLPTWTAWYAHQLPAWFHRMSVAVMFVIEIVVPFCIFGPRLIRHTGCVLLILLQLLIAATGNYTFFNLLSIVLCVPLLDDRMIRRLVPGRWREKLANVAQVRPAKLARHLAIALPAMLYVVVSVVLIYREIDRTRPVPRPQPQAQSWFDTQLMSRIAPFRSINGYGLFRSMTTQRPEIIIEGSNDGLVWRPYEFRHKPGDVTRRPRFVAPHQPRLDWQMWFAALSPRGNERWLVPLLQRLLEGEPRVLELIGHNPFPDLPPRYVRLVYYRYTFTTPAEKRGTGTWWKRESLGVLFGPVSLPGRDF